MCVGPDRHGLYRCLCGRVWNGCGQCACDAYQTHTRLEIEQFESEMRSFLERERAFEDNVARGMAFWRFAALVLTVRHRLTELHHRCLHRRYAPGGVGALQAGADFALKTHVRSGHVHFR